MKIRTVLRECAVDLLGSEPNVTVERIVTCAWSRHGDAFAEAQAQMINQAAREIVANIMRDLTDDDETEQLTLPGLGLPSAIAVQTPDGTYYVRSDKATWPELQAGRKVRVANVERAAARLDDYDEALANLEPIMASDPTITVADALRKMAAVA